MANYAVKAGYDQASPDNLVSIAVPGATSPVGLYIYGTSADLSSAHYVPDHRLEFNPAFERSLGTVVKNGDHLVIMRFQIMSATAYVYAQNNLQGPVTYTGPIPGDESYTRRNAILFIRPFDRDNIRTDFGEDFYQGVEWEFSIKGDSA